MKQQAHCNGESNGAKSTRDNYQEFFDAVFARGRQQTEEQFEALLPSVASRAAHRLIAQAKQEHLERLPVDQQQVAVLHRLFQPPAALDLQDEYKAAAQEGYDDEGLSTESGEWLDVSAAPAEEVDENGIAILPLVREQTRCILDMPPSTCPIKVDTLIQQAALASTEAEGGGAMSLITGDRQCRGERQQGTASAEAPAAYVPSRQGTASRCNGKLPSAVSQGAAAFGGQDNLLHCAQAVFDACQQQQVQVTSGVSQRGREREPTTDDSLQQEGEDDESSAMELGAIAHSLAQPTGPTTGSAGVMAFELPGELLAEAGPAIVSALCQQGESAAADDFESQLLLAQLGLAELPLAPAHPILRCHEQKEGTSGRMSTGMDQLTASVPLQAGAPRDVVTTVEAFRLDPGFDYDSVKLTPKWVPASLRRG